MSDLVWTKDDPERGPQLAFLEGAPGPGHVMGWVYAPIKEGFPWRYGAGCDNPERTLTIMGDEAGWTAESEDAAKLACLHEMQRIRRWANGAGPESIPALAWSGINGTQITRHGRIDLSLYESGRGIWLLGIDATVGAPEQQGYLRAVPVHPDDPLGIGEIEFPTEAAAKAWAQEQAAALCRWLGGDPDRVVDPAQEVLALA